LGERLEAGDVAPAGVCPECGAFAHEPEGSDAESKREGFGLAQLLFAVECVLGGALDLLSSGLPTDVDRSTRARCVGPEPGRLSDYERGVLSQAGMSLAVLYAQLFDDGLSPDDALGMAGDFYGRVEWAFAAAWSPGGEEAIRGRLPKPGEGAKLFSEIAGVLWPDALLHARAFIDNCPPRPPRRCGISTSEPAPEDIEPRPVV
jgi:hypothetical protein